MVFEVGKKYKRKRDTSIYTCLAVHKAGGSTYAMVDSNISWIPTTALWHAEWSEYKEPRTASRWINVWDFRGEVRMNSSLYDSKEEAEHMAARAELSDWKLLDTIEVKWVEKC